MGELSLSTNCPTGSSQSVEPEGERNELATHDRITLNIFQDYLMLGRRDGGGNKTFKQGEPQGSDFQVEEDRNRAPKAKLCSSQLAGSEFHRALFRTVGVMDLHVTWPFPFIVVGDTTGSPCRNVSGSGLHYFSRLRSRLLL